MTSSRHIRATKIKHASPPSAGWLAAEPRARDSSDSWTLVSNKDMHTVQVTGRLRAQGCSVFMHSVFTAIQMCMSCVLAKLFELPNMPFQDSPGPQLTFLITLCNFQHHFSHSSIQLINILLCNLVPCSSHLMSRHYARMRPLGKDLIKLINQGKLPWDGFSGFNLIWKLPQNSWSLQTGVSVLSFMLWDPTALCWAGSPSSLRLTDRESLILTFRSSVPRGSEDAYHLMYQFQSLKYGNS